MLQIEKLIRIRTRAEEYLINPSQIMARTVAYDLIDLVDEYKALRLSTGDERAAEPLCEHEHKHPGPKPPKRWGDLNTEVCDNCQSIRTGNSTEYGPWMPLRSTLELPFWQADEAVDH